MPPYGGISILRRIAMSASLSPEFLEQVNGLIHLQMDSLGKGQHVEGARQGEMAQNLMLFEVCKTLVYINAALEDIGNTLSELSDTKT